MIIHGQISIQISYLFIKWMTLVSIQIDLDVYKVLWIIGKESCSLKKKKLQIEQHILKFSLNIVLKKKWTNVHYKNVFLNIYVFPAWFKCQWNSNETEDLSALFDGG